MRFRPHLGYQIWTQIVTLSFWIFIVVASLAKHHAVTMFPGVAILWTFNLSAQITTYLSKSWRLDPDGIHIDNLWSSRLVPYADIVAIRPRITYRKPSRTEIDIDFGRIGSAFHPQGATIVNPRERSAFLEELRRVVPRAAFDL